MGEQYAKPEPPPAPTQQERRAARQNRRQWLKQRRAYELIRLRDWLASQRLVGATG